jgi:glycosyltransferase involved in cell wall biosynthesis
LAGAGRYIHGIVRGLAAIDHDNEYFVFLKAHDAAHFNELPSNVHLVRLPVHARALRLFWQHARAGAQAQKLGLEVWHGTHYTLPGFTHNLACVATFHDLGVFHHPQLYPLDKRVYFRRVMQQAAARAHHIVSVSEATTRDLQSLLLPRSRGPKVTTVLSGVEEKFFRAVAAREKARVRREHGLAAPFVLFVGTFEKRKNLVLLLRAFHEFCQRGAREHVLVLAGQAGNGSAEVAAAIGRLGLQERVRVLGYVAEEDLPGLYQSAELFVMPSLYEGFGFPLLEAMAGGGVALAANNSSLRELAGHAEMLCEETPAAWARKIEALLLDKKLRQELMRHGVQRARHFFWERSAEKLREVYERAAAERVRRPHEVAVSTNANGALRYEVIPGLRGAPARHAHKLDELAAADNTSLKGGISGARSAQKISLAAAIKKTLAYSDLFDYPLTAEEIHRGLFEHVATRFEVAHELEALCAKSEIARREHYYCLPGRERCIELRERRGRASARILQSYGGVLRLIKNFPFIRAVALSGTLAFHNAKGDDDLDLFVIVEAGRLWTVYLGLVLALKLLGRRREVCLNCLVDTAHLAIAERDFFVAHQIAFLRPLGGVAYLREFWRANDWCAQSLPQMAAASAADAIIEKEDAARTRARWRNALETVLRWRAFAAFERLVFSRYRRRIKRLTPHLDARGISAEAGQIKLFTNDHRFHVQRRLEQRLQQLHNSTHVLQREEPQTYATL